VRIEVLPSSERPAAVERWRALEHHLGNERLKNSCHWISTWLNHFGTGNPFDAGIPYSFVFGKHGTEDVGAALITNPTFDLTLVRVPAIAIGTAGEPIRERTWVQYNQLLVDAAHTQSFAQKLMDLLAKRKWSIAWLEGFTEEHGSALLQAAAKNRISVDVTEEPSPTFTFEKARELAAAGKNALSPLDAVLAQISHDQRSKIRRSMKNLDRLLGPRCTEWAQTRQQAHDILEELMKLHTIQWERKGEPGAFGTMRLRSYHRELVDVLFPKNLIAFRVKQGETTVGCLVNLVEDDAGHTTNFRSGFVVFEDHALSNRLKPGYVTNLLFAAEAMRHGYAEFDLLDGHMEHKRHISNSSHTLIHGEAHQGLRAQAFATARDIYRRGRSSELVRGLRQRFTK
jgi:CelD/BcsL family acetyltransferase involved in cellulose biosynthesis